MGGCILMKPTGIVDNFGDLHLCCPSCKETIYFPLIGDERPTHCKKCGAKFEWSEEKTVMEYEE